MKVFRNDGILLSVFFLQDIYAQIDVLGCIYASVNL
jgi:hypothetical protein